MFIIENYILAVVFCFITMLCWGSWANTQKLASRSWPFQLYYWDYSLGVLLISLIFAFTLGSVGENGRGFIEDLMQADLNSIGTALAGGIIFNLCNILLVIAINIAGMAVAFPVGVGIALVLGVIVNYIGQPKGDPFWLFLGVGLVTVAIILNALAYRKVPGGGKTDIRKGLIISILSGILMAFFYRFVAMSMSENFVTPAEGKLTPYTAVVVFSTGLFLSNFLFNTINMRKPISGVAVKYSEYFSFGTPKLHLIGLLGGVTWGVGMSFSIIASGKAGNAISYGLAQGATLVAAFWGVVIWREFKTAPKSANTLIGLMFFFFIVGLLSIIYSNL